MVMYLVLSGPKVNCQGPSVLYYYFSFFQKYTGSANFFSKGKAHYFKRQAKA